MTRRFPPVVAAVDGSPASTTVLDEAVDVAHRRLLPLHVVRIVPDAPAEAAVAAARELDDLRAAVASRLPAAMVDVVVRPGPPEAVLAEESRTAALLVLAANSGAPGSPGRLDPTATALLRSAGCPVLLARPPGDGAGVVVGVDGSPRTREVLDAAMTEACVRSTTLTVVAAGLAPAERRAVASSVLDLRTGHPAVPVVLGGADTDLTGALVTASSEAALVVVGRALDPAAPSSEAAVAVAGRVLCPLLVVPCAGNSRGRDRGTARRSAVALSRLTDSDGAGHRPVARRPERRR